MFQPVQSLPEQRSGPPWLPVLALAGFVLAGVLLGLLVLAGGRGPAPSGTAVAASPSAAPRTPSATRPEATQQSTPAAASPTAPASPDGSPTDSPTASEPAGSPGASPDGPTGSIPPDIAAQIQDVIEQVPPIRELEPQRDVPYEFVTREQFQTDLEELLAEEQDPELVAAEERLYQRLGLLPDDADLEELLLELYGAGVAAYYQPDNGRFYIIERDAPFGPLDRMYVAHEYTHALQDQYYDLEGTSITDPSQGDAALAQLAAIEGDATWLMVLWAQQNLSFEEIFQLLEESLAPAGEDVLANMPQILSRQLAFPYTEGMMFVSEIQGAEGWDPINEMLQAPPVSTEQVLHPEKYLAGEQPVTVESADISGDLGDGWSSVYEQTFGELITQIWVGGGEEPPMPVPGAPPEYPFAEIAAGWGGDRLRMYEGPNDAWAIVWQTAWDTQSDASEFSERAQALQDTLDGASEVTSEGDGAGNNVVTVFAASDDRTLRDVQEALEQP